MGLRKAQAALTAARALVDDDAETLGTLVEARVLYERATWELDTVVGELAEGLKLLISHECAKVRQKIERMGGAS